MTDKKIARAMNVSRREFLRSAAGAAIAWPTIVPSSVFGANAPSNCVTVGCIGLGGQGRGNMRSFNGNPGSVVFGVCDVDASNGYMARHSVEVDAG